jgi:DNA-binding NarL/FixJ family response regulator
VRPIETPSAPGSLGWNRKTATLALLSFAMLIVSLDQYIVVVALPDIARDLGYSAHTLQSVISAYAVAPAGFLLFGGRAADLLGRRRILATGLALYAGAALAGGLATGPGMLLAARALQGLGGALVFRELEILVLLAAGTPNPRIAEQLVVSLDTVKKHVSHVLGKLGAANRTEAVTRARQLGLIP